MTTIGTQVGPYRIEALLGVGGMAAVYRVVHGTLGSQHALKVLHLPTATIRARLLREGTIQAQLVHPNVVRVTGTVDVQGGPALVLDLVDGPDLGRVLASVDLSLAQIDCLGRDLLAGVGAAHALGSIHRDLKPANILIAIDGEPTAMVADFGIAKLYNEASGGLSRTGVAMGTPAYMSPEQAAAEPDLDPRSDVFALGCILYEMLVGRRAFTGRNALSIMRAITSGAHLPIDDVAPTAPERMRRAVRAALRVDRADRPRDATRLLALWTDDGGAPRPAAAWDHEAREALAQCRAEAPRPPADQPTVTLDATPSASGLQAGGPPQHDLPPAVPVPGRDVDDLVAQIRSGCSLITLVGPDGVGRTALAVAVARQLLTSTAGGAWFVDLEDVRGHDGFAMAIDRALTLPARATTPPLRPPRQGFGHRPRGRGGHPLNPAAIAALRARPPVVLVLDGHDGVRALARGAIGAWLRSVPNLRVVCTGRSRIGLPAERVNAVDPLPDLLPDAPDAWREAVGGLPLSARLARPLLDAEPPTHPGAALLDTVVARACMAVPDPDGLATLATTRGPWTTPSAHALLGRAPSWDAWTAAGLVSPRGPGHAMHPGVRRALNQRATEAPDAAALAALPVDGVTVWFEQMMRLTVARAAEPATRAALLTALLDQPRPRWVAPVVFDAVQSDEVPAARVLAARCAACTGRTDLADRIADARAAIATVGGPTGARLRADLAVVVAGTGRDPRALLDDAAAAIGDAPNAWRIVSIRAAEAYTRFGVRDEAIAIDRALVEETASDPIASLQVHLRLARNLLAVGDPRAGLPAASEAVRLATSAGRWRTAVSARVLKAELALALGDVDGASAAASSALGDARHLGSARSTTRALLVLGWTALSRGFGDRAWTELTDAHELARGLGDAALAAAAAAGLAHVRIGRGLPGDAVAPLDRALDELPEAHHPVLHVARCRALVALGELDEAAAALTRARAGVVGTPARGHAAVSVLAAAAHLGARAGDLGPLDRLEALLGESGAIDLRLAPLLDEAVAAAAGQR